MLDAALIGSAFALGLAGSPHCAVMCSSPCAAMCGRRRRRLASFLLGRLLSYTAAGILVASSVQWFSSSAPLLQPLWALLHAAMLAVGLALIVRGRLPMWLARVGERAVPGRAPFVAGMAWVAWPCGLLQSALLLAALCNSAWSGGLTMAGFALSSSAGLLLAPTLLRHLPTNQEAVMRLAGLGLVIASGWALGHGLWQRVSGLC